MATHLVGPHGEYTRRHDLAVGLARVLDYAFGLLYALLGIRLILNLINARTDTGFFQFIATVTNPFYAPFKGIVASDTVDGTHPLVWPLVVAIVAYMLLHAALRGVLRLIDDV